MSPKLARPLRLASLCSFALLGVGFLLVPQELMSLLREVGLADAWSGAPISSEVQEHIDFVYRVLGAVLVGWASSLLLALHSTHSLWVGACWSFGLWFALDTAASLWTGHPRNAVLNLASLLAFGLPHFWLRSERSGRADHRSP